MNRTSSGVLCTLVFMTATSSCIRLTDDSFAGTWTQQVNMPEMGTSGIETLTLSNDHTMKGTNRLRLCEDNGFFKCVMQFTTSLDGTWEYNGKDILLHFDTDSFTFKEDAEGPSITLSGERGDHKEFEMLKPAMSQKIVRTIDSIYNALYTRPSMQTIRIENASILNSNTLQGYTNERLVTYKRSDR